MNCLSLENDILEGGVIGVFGKNFHAAYGAIENVIDQSAGGMSRASWHNERV